MPTYEYECAACGPVDVFQRMSDAPLKTCPTCGSRRFRRLISGGSGLIFKGSGFYKTDYEQGAGSSYSKAKEAETTKPKTEAASKTETAPSKTEGKPAKAAKATSTAA